jgi:ABC-type transport system involved in cytochrome c biogenesis permease component
MSQNKSPAVPNILWALIQKELVAEVRRSEFFVSVIILSFLFGIISSVGISMLTLHPSIRLLVSTYTWWLLTTITILTASEKMWNKEIATEALSTILLAGVRPSTLYIAKSLVLCLGTIISITTIVSTGIFIADVRISSALSPIAILVLSGSIGLSALCTLTSILSIRTDRGASVQIMITLPLLIPFVIALVRASIDTLAITTNEPWSLSGATSAVIGLALIYPSLGVLLSDRAMGDSA